MNFETINPSEVYERISTGKPYGKNLKPYPLKIIKNVIKELEDLEEYEMCLKLENFIKKRFKHEDYYNKFVDIKV